MSISVVFYKSSGEITRVRSGSVAGVTHDAESSGGTYLITDESVDVNANYISSGEVLTKPPQPNDGSVFDFSSGEWAFDIELARSLRWTEVKGSRSAYEFGTFELNGNVYQCDEVSQRRIQGAVQLAVLDSEMTIDWTLADNSVIQLTAAQLIVVGGALAAHVNLSHERGRILRAEIEMASTEIELEAITWSI